MVSFINRKWAIWILFFLVLSFVLSSTGIASANLDEPAVVTAAELFTPGDGGNLPGFLPFEPASNKIGGLYITKNYKKIEFYFNGNPIIHHNIEMEFLPPSQFNASGYTLQYSEDGGNSWNNYQSSGTDVTTNSVSQESFCIVDPAGNYQYRLRVNGGVNDGFTSNTAEAQVPQSLSDFAWSLDESMAITGIICPYIGRGLQASFTATKYVEGGDNVTYTNEHMAYQWYRVNPVTYEMTPISGATNLQYVTTAEDAGCYLLIRADGDGTDIGGYVQVLSKTKNIMPNKAYVTNSSVTGFTLNLYNSVSGLTVQDLILYDKDWNEVTISSITPGDNNAIYNIGADLNLANAPYYLQNNSGFWQIVSEMMPGHIMPGVQISLSSSGGGEEPTVGQIEVLPAATGYELHLRGLSDYSADKYYARVYQGSSSYTGSSGEVLAEFDKRAYSTEYEYVSQIITEAFPIGNYTMKFYTDEARTLLTFNSAFQINPMVHISSPGLHDQTTHNNINITGYISNYSSITLNSLQFSLNSSSWQDIGSYLDTTTGQFSIPATLVSGNNHFEVQMQYLLDSATGSHQIWGEIELIDECFIATAAFGSKLAPAVALLREFRDKVLLTNAPGQAFVNFYYKHSPAIAKVISKNEVLKSVVRFLLLPFIIIAWAAIHYEASLIILILLMVMALIRRKYKQRLA